MPERHWRERVLREGLRLAAFGLPVAVGASLLLFYALLWVDGLDSWSRGVVLAVSLPLLLVTPLLGWVAVERVRLYEARRAFNQAASRDPVSGFLRGPRLAELVDRRRNSASPDGRRGAFLLVDASRLNDINRKYGFEWHDEALRHVAASIQGAVRSTDLVGRTGADTFGVFLGGARAEDALEVGQRIRAAVSASYFAPDDIHGMIDVTVAGVTFDEEMRFGEIYAQALDMLEDPVALHSTALTIARREPGASAGKGD